MEVLELNGVKYVKASSIARDLGYTADYVGQLCRGGKVNAQLVGRSWYVNEDSINEHKKSRYRSNAAKTLTALKTTLVEEEVEEETPTAKRKAPLSTSRQHFYNRATESGSVYVEDGAELIPTLKKREESDESTEVEVRHADAKPVSVRKTHSAYSLKATERPKIKFKGDVSIVEPEETVEKEAKETREPTQEKTPSGLSDTVEKPQTRRLSASEVLEKERMRSKMMRLVEDVDDNKNLQKLPLRHAGAISMTRGAPVRTKEKGELRITPVAVRKPATRQYTFPYIVASLLLGLALSVGLALTETSLIATDNSIERSFFLNISAVFDAVNSLK